MPDSGPAFAETMGLETSVFGEADWSNSRIWIIDLRLVEDEYQSLETAIRQNPATTFLLRIVDPYWETCLQAINTQFVFRHISTPNVGVVSAYQPEEACQLLELACRPARKFFIFPNAYDPRKEISINQSWPERKKVIALAGATGDSLYPYRTFLKRKRLLDPHLWGRVHLLPHPGYADIGQKTNHQVSGDKFVTWMGGHRFAYLCPGRCHLEFIKYRECAYAGCVPVGKPAKSLGKEISNLIQPLDWVDYPRQRNRIFGLSTEECQTIAKKYRQAFAQERNPELLRDRLTRQVLAWKP